MMSILRRAALPAGGLLSAGAAAFYLQQQTDASPLVSPWHAGDDLASVTVPAVLITHTSTLPLPPSGEPQRSAFYFQHCRTPHSHSALSVQRFMSAQAEAAKVQALDPKEFRPFKLIEKEQLSHNTARYVFELPKGEKAGLPVASCLVVR